MAKGGKFAIVIGMVALTLLGQARPAAAVTPLMWGPGIDSCGKWIESRRAGGVQSSYNEIWVLGFISGANAANSTEAGKGLDTAGVFAWLDNACAANPLETIADATVGLYFELLKKLK